MSQNNDSTQKLLITGALIWGGYQFVLKPILEGLNVVDTTEETAAKKTNETYGAGGGKTIEQNPWNPNYVQLVIKANGGKQIQLFTVANLNSMVQTIWDAKGSLFSSLPFGDDNENAVYGVMRKIISKTQLSQFAGHFQKLKDRDLYEYLNSFMNSDEMGIVNNIVKGYKQGIIVNGKLS